MDEIRGNALKQEIKSIFNEMFFDPDNISYCGLGPQSGGTVLERSTDANALVKHSICIRRDMIESLFLSSAGFWMRNPGSYSPLPP